MSLSVSSYSGRAVLTERTCSRGVERVRKAEFMREIEENERYRKQMRFGLSG